MDITADYLVGRRFTLEYWQRDGKGRTIRHQRDLTIVAWHPEKGCRVHGEDKSRKWYPMETICSMLQTGNLFESEYGAPFVWARES